MRLLATAALALTLTACIGGGDVPDRDTEPDTDSDEPTDTDTDEPVDTSAGTDADGDGFTVEAGDCDDSDVFINPGWNEANARATDGKDNDCDGRVDEVFAGLLVVDIDTNGEAAPRLKHVDSFGDLKGEVSLSVPVDGLWADEALDGDGWIVLGGDARIARVKPDGSVDRVLDLSAQPWPEDDPPLGFVGLATHHQDSAYYVATGDRLLRLTWDASSWQIETAVTWNTILVDESHDATVVAVAADRFSPRLALVGNGGSFGWWSPGETTVDWRLSVDPEEPPYAMSIAHGRDAENDGVFVLGQDASATGIWRWRDSQDAWTLHAAWPNPDDYTPVSFAIEDETGDFYITAFGGWDQFVYRTVADGTYTGVLFSTNQEFRFHRHRAPLVLWE